MIEDSIYKKSSTCIFAPTNNFYLIWIHKAEEETVIKQNLP